MFIPHKTIILLMMFFSFNVSPGAVTTLTPGNVFGGNIVDGTTGVGDFVLDFGIVLASTNTIDPIIFESGGNGIGTAIALVGDDLVVYQDQNSGVDTVITLDVSGFFGQAIAVRLDGDFSLANGSRALNLTVIPAVGAVLTAGLSNITSATDDFSGGNATAFGGFSGSIAGGSEAGSPLAALDDSSRDVSNASATNVLDSSVLAGILYTEGDATTQRAAPLPTAALFGFAVPEPSSSLLLLAGALGMICRRSRGF